MVTQQQPLSRPTACCIVRYNAQLTWIRHMQLSIHTRGGPAILLTSPFAVTLCSLHILLQHVPVPVLLPARDGAVHTPQPGQARGGALPGHRAGTYLQGNFPARGSDERGGLSAGIAWTYQHLVSNAPPGSSSWQQYTSALHEHPVFSRGAGDLWPARFKGGSAGVQAASSAMTGLWQKKRVTSIPCRQS